MTDAVLLRNAVLVDGQRVDLRIEEETIAAITPAGSLDPGNAEAIDLDGALVSRSFVDGHVHLDKALLGRAFVPHRPGHTVADRIAREKDIRREIAYPVETRARNLIERIIPHGTTAVRSHVDVDTEVGLAGLEALLGVRDRLRPIFDIEIVAFPQSGIIADPGTADLLDAAIRTGADLVGGLDPAGIDADLDGHLDAIFAIAERHGVGLDIHLHDPGALGCFELRQIAARTSAAGLTGKVAVSHAFALGDAGDAEFGRTAEALARAGVAIMTNGPGPVAMPPVKRLRDAGVIVFAGSDNIRDAWSPYGNGDMLERAMLIGYRQHFLSDEDLGIAFDMATRIPSRLLGLGDGELRAGGQADLVAIPADSVPEAVAGRPPRRLVMKGGRILARDGVLVEPLP